MYSTVQCQSLVDAEILGYRKTQYTNTQYWEKPPKKFKSTYYFMSVFAIYVLLVTYASIMLDDENEKWTFNIEFEICTEKLLEPNLGQLTSLLQNES